MATLAELTAELAEIKAALQAIRLGGQSYTIGTGTGGTTRTVTMADYDVLMSHKNELESKISMKNNTRATIIRPGW
jgi:hypothetical protein